MVARPFPLLEDIREPGVVFSPSFATGRTVLARCGRRRGGAYRSEARWAELDQTGRPAGSGWHHVATTPSLPQTFFVGGYQYTLAPDPVVEPASLVAMTSPSRTLTTSVAIGSPGHRQPVTDTVSCLPTVSRATVVMPSGTLVGNRSLRIGSARLLTGTWVTTRQVDTLVTTIRAIEVRLTVCVTDPVYRALVAVGLSSQTQGW